MENFNMKSQTILEMRRLMEKFQQKLAILDALDRDTSCSNAFDHMDQVSTLASYVRKVNECIERCELVNGDVFKDREREMTQ